MFAAAALLTRVTNLFNGSNAAARLLRAESSAALVSSVADCAETAAVMRGG